MGKSSQEIIDSIMSRVLAFFRQQYHDSDLRKDTRGEEAFEEGLRNVVRDCIKNEVLKFEVPFYPRLAHGMCSSVAGAISCDLRTGEIHVSFQI